MKNITNDFMRKQKILLGMRRLRFFADLRSLTVYLRAIETTAWGK